MPILVPTDILTIDKITLVEDFLQPSNCTSLGGHCYGSDGGSGIPKDQKVAEGRGGEQEVWTLSADKLSIDKQEIYARCQYCLKLSYVKNKE